MCDPATAGLIISAVSAGGSAVNNDQALRKQDQETARGIMRASEIQREASARVNKNIQDVAASNPDAERKAALDQFTRALQTAQPTKGAGFDTPGAASDRFVSDAATAKTAATGENAALAGNLSRIDAPMYQRLRETQGRAATASDLSILEGNSKADAFLTQLRAAGHTPNPWIDAASQFGGAYANATAGRAPKPRIPTPSPNDVGQYYNGGP